MHRLSDNVNTAIESVHYCYCGKWKEDKLSKYPIYAQAKPTPNKRGRKRKNIVSSITISKPIKQKKPTPVVVSVPRINQITNDSIHKKGTKSTIRNK